MSTCFNCHNEYSAKLAFLPTTARKQLVDILCSLKVDPTCDDLKECETLTTLSPFEIRGTNLCISYTGENGIKVERCIDLSILFNHLLDNVDPKCIASAEDWANWDFRQRFQALVDDRCQVTTTTTTTTSTSTTTTTTHTPYACTVYSLHNTTSNQLYYSYIPCGDNFPQLFALNQNATVQVCILTGSLTYANGIVVTEVGECVPPTTTTTSTTTTSTTTTTTVPPTTTTTTSTTTAAPTTTTTTTASPSTTTTTTACNCDTGYTASPTNDGCIKVETQAATIVNSGYCFAQSQLAGQYSSTGTKLYTSGYSSNLVGSNTVLTSSYWKEAAGQVTGPMNREGVWIDSDCDGLKNALTTGAVLQFTYTLSLSTPRTVYVGVGGDNTFKLQVNGATVVDCDTTTHTAGGIGSSANFNFWHIFPVTLNSGVNYLTFSAVGDGSTNDAFAAVVYNNTSAQITSATSDSDLNILFKTSNLIGTTLDIATCASGWFLDTSGGSGNYICRRVLTLNCGEVAP